MSDENLINVNAKMNAAKYNGGDNCGWPRSIRALRTICFEQLLRRLLFVAFVVLSSLVEHSSANAVVDRRRNADASTSNQRDSSYDESLQKYLENFGYLPKDNPEMSNLRTDLAVKLAIGRMQGFAGLQQTGVIDEQTKQLLQTKRCGIPDVNYDDAGSHRRRKRYSTASKWQKTDITYNVENWPSELDRPRTRRVIYDASQVWSKGGVSKISLKEIGDRSADINIKFGSLNHGDSYPFDGPGVVLGHAFFPATGLGGDIHFDSDERWTDQMDTRDRSINLLSTAAHEFGHSLGLGHSKVREALMYPYYKSASNSFSVKLNYDDILGLQKLYGIGSSGTPTSPAPVITTTPFFEQPVEPNTLPPVTIPTTASTPHPCDTHVDAVARLRGETFVFKNKYYWRFNQDGTLIESPSEIVRFWNGLPDNLTRIDAIYEWPERDIVTMFIGRSFYEFSANRLRGPARDIRELGLPDDLKRIDAAFVWEYNGKTYFFAGEKYWRLDENNRKIEPEYPRKMSIWEDVPHNVDAAFTDKSGATYFFKDELIYKFNDYFMRVEKSFPRRINSFWGHCLDVKQEKLMNFVNSSVAVKRCALATVLFWLFFTYSVLLQRF